MTNQDIVNSLPAARELYTENVEGMIEMRIHRTGKGLDFEDVRNLAEAVTVEGTAINAALIRIIECENCITMETV